MIGNFLIGSPRGGINATDVSFAIEDNQAQKLVNMRVVGNGIESIRPSTNFNAYVDFIGAYSPTVNDCVVFRNKERTITKYLFAHAGHVYSASSPVALAVGDIGYVGDPDARINLVIFRNQVFIFNGVDANYKYDGVNLWTMGIDAPTVPIVILNAGGTLTRHYYYTYYNSIDGTESNPDVGAISSTCRDEATSITVVASDDPQVDKIRIYRTGEGITTPRLCQEVDNVDDTIVDDSTEGTVALGRTMEIDHDKPPILANGLVQNNRLFAWGGINAEDGSINRDTLWISNEYEPQYMPIVPFIEQTVASSGGPIQLNPGDGGRIMDFIPWGGAGIAFKDTAVYRIQETEVGFYGYQVMAIPTALSERTAQVIGAGLIYLTDNGLVLLDLNENVNYIGYPIKYYTDLIDNFDSIASVAAYGAYILSFKSSTTGERQTFIYDQNTGWSGPHTVLGGTSYFVDVDGVLYVGRGDKAGIAKSNYNILGINPSMREHVSIPIEFFDKAREFNYDDYTRIRSAKINTQNFGVIPEPLTFSVCTETDVELDSTEFTLTDSGTTNIGIGNEAHGNRLACRITGNITVPVRINNISLLLEKLARVQE